MIEEQPALPLGSERVHLELGRGKRSLGPCLVEVLRAHHQGAGHRLAVGADELALERPAAVEPDVDRDRLFPWPGIDLDEGVEVRRHDRVG